MKFRFYSRLLLSILCMALTGIVVCHLSSLTATATTYKLFLRDAPLTIKQGNTVTKSVWSPAVTQLPGTFDLRMKWHAVNIIPTYNSLKVTLKHGSSTVIPETTCFSIHSDKSPKCIFSKEISRAEALREGDWTLTLVNNSAFDVTGFDIEKGSDLNPLVPNFKSTFNSICPQDDPIDMEGVTLSVDKFQTQDRKLTNIRSENGYLALKMKWHVVSVLPVYNLMRIAVMNGNTVVATKDCYSIHSDKSPKCDFYTKTEGRPADQWKLRINNISKYDVVGFDIRKGDDINPLVPFFFSRFVWQCD